MIDAAAFPKSPSLSQKLAEWGLIPSILLTTVISNQLTWSVGHVIARLIGWLTILGASIIVTSHFRRKVWPFILVLLVPISKVFQGFSGGSEGVQLGPYIILYGLLLGLAGSILVATRLEIVRKQFYYICLLNIVFMFLQVAGIADWSQFATTHAASKISHYPIAFFNVTDDFDVSQLRPAGLLYGNQYLSVITLFGLALHFSREKRGFKTGTLVMCTMAVLSMAKLVFAGFILISLCVIIMGTKYQRKAILKGLALTVLLMYLYKLLFPGLFEFNLRFEQIIFSASTRISSILYKQGAEEALSDLRLMSDEYQEMDVNVKILAPLELEEEAQISGYEDLVNHLPYVIAALALFVPFYIWGFLKLRRHRPDLSPLTVTSLIIVLIIPAAGSLWGSPIYLLICGFAFLPLFFLLSTPGNLKTT